MVTMFDIQPEELRGFITIAFQGDTALINTYHLVNGSLDKCVNSTVMEIKKVARTDKLSYYGIIWDGRPIGFTVLGKNFLISFGINLRFRTKEILPLWWQLVCTALNEEFVTWIFKKNTRAIDFLKRNGMIVIEEHPDYIAMGHYSHQSVHH